MCHVARFMLTVTDYCHFSKTHTRQLRYRSVSSGHYHWTPIMAISDQQTFR